MVKYNLRKISTYFPTFLYPGVFLPILLVLFCTDPFGWFWKQFCLKIQLFGFPIDFFLCLKGLCCLSLVKIYNFIQLLFVLENVSQYFWFCFSPSFLSDLFSSHAYILCFTFINPILVSLSIIFVYRVCKIKIWAAHLPVFDNLHLYLGLLFAIKLLLFCNFPFWIIF